MQRKYTTNPIVLNYSLLSSAISMTLQMKQLPLMRHGPEMYWLSAANCYGMDWMRAVINVRTKLLQRQKVTSVKWRSEASSTGQLERGQ